MLLWKKQADGTITQYWLEFLPEIFLIAQNMS
jgi:hypothetical protein